uniref:Phosphatidylcholine transfer protein n=1 Tax=Arcella intermedia TaxID=1963864 RepID=A0A6B2LI64_9EUKA
MNKWILKFEQKDAKAPWELFYKDAAVTVYRKFKQGTTYKYRTFATIPSAPTNYFAFYKDLEHWRKWDENVEEITILESKDNEDVVYWSVKFPFPLSSRDYIYKRFSMYYESHKMYVLTSTVCVHEAKKPTSKRVRVTTYKMLQLFRETPDGKCELVMDTLDDPQVALPGWVLSWVTKTAIPKFITRLTTECQNYTKLTNK